MKTIRCILKKGKERPLLGRHPWIFSGAIDEIDEGYQAGDLTKVYSSAQKYLGTGYFSPNASIAVRLLSFEDIEIDATFFEKRIQDAVRLRKKILPSHTDSYRVIHSEGDFLPGLIVDRYADFLVLQIHTAGMEKWREVILKSLLAEYSVRGIYEKGDREWRAEEGLSTKPGPAAGEEPPDFLEVQENSYTFWVDIKRGQKTGAFLDQRDNRLLIGNYARGRKVLNGFSYSAGFSVYAAKGGAIKTVSADSSEAALKLAKMNLESNGLNLKDHRWVQTDVFDYLRRADEEFDLIILDPPAFCKSKGQIHQASRGYKEINLSAIKKLASGGLLYTASCSSYIDADLFQKIVFAAAKDSGKDLRILAKTAHALDHPVSIAHPEGEYLKGLLCQVVT